MTSKLAVVPAIVRYQGVELQSGHMLAVEMEQPADGFAVVHQDGDDLEIISMHVHEADAVQACQQLASHIELLNAQGGTLQ